jgi:hypothetical protein
MKLSLLVAGVALIALPGLAAAQQVYPSPEAAAKDLIDSAKAGTAGFATRIFGKDGVALLSSGDKDTDVENVQEFNDAAAALNAIDEGENGEKLLRVGTNGWTLPLPLVKDAKGGWHFDPARGEEVILDRRVGYDELAAIAACRAYKDAQDEYFELDRDNNGVREYAQRFVSTPGKHDGLYWHAETQADLSPLDGFVDDANLEGRTGEAPAPYKGYFYRILKAQGPNAPGGAHTYVFNGLMVAGHAMVAWPADYGKSGVQTFLCGQNGVIYQKDLGANTASSGAAIWAFDPDASWKAVQ